MRAADFHSVSPALPPAALPIQLRQSSCRIGALGTLAFVAPAGLALLAPFVMLGHQLATDAATRQTLADRPLSAMLLAVGLVVWCALLALPLGRSLASFGRSRLVHIADGRVAVEERGVTGTQAWSEPLQSYGGLKHVVRTSLSSTRHELVLVHPVRGRSVLVGTADQLSDQQIADMASVLGLGVVPAGFRCAPAPRTSRSSARSARLSHAQAA